MCPDKLFICKFWIQIDVETFARHNLHISKFGRCRYDLLFVSIFCNFCIDHFGAYTNIQKCWYKSIDWIANYRKMQYTGCLLSIRNNNIFAIMCDTFSKKSNWCAARKNLSRNLPRRVDRPQALSLIPGCHCWLKNMSSCSFWSSR